MTTDELTIPYMDVNDLGAALVMATEDQRFALLTELFVGQHRSIEDVPEAHRKRGPLSSWCWLVLVVNGITPEYDADGKPYPLTHYGIDLAFASSEVGHWIFFLA